MKKILYLLLFFQSFQFIYSTNNFNAKPIITDFYGSVAWDSTIIVYGSEGTYWLSNNQFESWETKKAFDRGVIVKMIKQNDKIIAITKDGQIAVSYDLTLSWVKIENLEIEENEELFYEFLEFNKNIVFRTLSHIYMIDSTLKVTKKVDEPMLFSGFKYYYQDSPRDPIFKFKDKLYSIFDTNKINIYNNKLELEKTIIINEKLQNDSYIIYLSFYPYSENNFGLQIGTNFYITNETLDTFKLVEDNSYFTYGQLYNNNLYCMYLGWELYKLDNFRFEKIKSLSNDFVVDYPKRSKSYIYNDILISYGSNNFIGISSLNGNEKSKLIQFGSGRNKVNLNISKIKLNKEFLTLRENGNGYGTDLYSLQLNNNKFNGIVHRADTNNKYFDGGNPRNATFQTIFYDEKDDLLYMGSNHRVQDENALFISNNQGKSFKRYNVNFITNYGNSQNYIMQKAKFGNYLQGVYNISYAGSEYSCIDVFTKDIKKIFRVGLVNEQFHRYDILDTNTYIVLSLDRQSNKLLYKTTLDKGETWEVYKEYPTSVYLLESKELELNGKKIWAYTYFDFVTSQFNLDVIDVEDRKVYNVFEKELTQDEIDTWDYIGFDAAKEKFYLSFYNTLMVSSNIFDENIKWETFNYPNNGRVNKKFQIFDKTIFARYEDDRNEDNVYWINGIEMVGDPTSIENTENQIEEVNYLYTMPPYPNPTRSEVTAKFYWDSRIDIDNSEIAVYDITGNKVSGKENLSLEKLNEWSGNIKWNCTGVPSGTYLIKIQHGNNTKTVKVVVN